MKKKKIIKRKRRQKAIHRRILKQKKRWNKWIKLKHVKPIAIETRKLNHLISLAAISEAPHPLQAPSIFSLIENPEEVLGFFHAAGEFLKKKVEVILDFSDIEKVTSDAIALLMAKITNRKFCNNTRVYGKPPDNKQLDKIFFESGFYKCVGLDKRKPEQGIIHTKKNNYVDRDVATEARKLTAQKTFGNDKPIKPLYRTLIECMANTKKHAKGKQVKDETWWLAVYNDPKTYKTSFSFIDTGVGIFKSAKIKKITKFAQKLGITSNTQILKDMLNGEIESSTGLPYRGKGLPKIHSDFKNRNISRLFILSNNVYANLEADKFVELNKPLNGTFLYWEILPEQNN